MNSRNNIKLGYVSITLANGSKATAYIREYSTATLQARVLVNGEFIQASWNGFSWSQVQG